MSRGLIITCPKNNAATYLKPKRRNEPNFGPPNWNKTKRFPLIENEPIVAPRVPKAGFLPNSHTCENSMRNQS